MTKITKNNVELLIVLNKCFPNGKLAWAVNCEALKVFVVGGTPRSALVLFANKVKTIDKKIVDNLLE